MQAAGLFISVLSLQYVFVTLVKPLSSGKSNYEGAFLQRYGRSNPSKLWNGKKKKKKLWESYKLTVSKVVCRAGGYTIESFKEL